MVLSDLSSPQRFEKKIPQKWQYRRAGALRIYQKFIIYIWNFTSVINGNSSVHKWCGRGEAGVDSGLFRIMCNFGRGSPPNPHVHGFDDCGAYTLYIWVLWRGLYRQHYHAPLCTLSTFLSDNHSTSALHCTKSNKIGSGMNSWRCSYWTTVSQNLG